MQIFVKAKCLKAALVLAGKLDIRYYLNGVFIEAYPGETRCIATDGHRAGVIRDSQANEVREKVQFIIPRDVIEALRIAVRDYDLPILIEVPAGSDGLHKIGFPGAMREFKPIDGKFPDYRRIFPTKVSGEAAHYLPEYLDDFSTIMRIMVGKKDATMIRVHYNGEDAALVTGACEQFVGVVMPWRMHDSKTKKPIFMHDTSWALSDAAAPALAEAA